MKTRSSTKSSKDDYPSKKHAVASQTRTLGGSGDIQEDTISCLQHCFGSLAKSIWWRILPLDDDYDDISVGMGVDYEDLLPLMLHYGLLYTDKSNSSCPYNVPVIDWTNFLQARLNGKFEFTYYDLNYKKSLIFNKYSRHYFVCSGTPIYPRVKDQLMAVKNGEFAYRDLRFQYRLKQKITHQAYTVRTSSVVGQFCHGKAKGPPRQIKKSTTIELKHGTLDDKTKEKVDFALKLDLDREPRLNREGMKEIVVHERKYASRKERYLAVSTALSWGWKDDRLYVKTRARIGRAACRQVAYDSGYRSELSAARLPQWWSDMVDGSDTGDTNDALSAKRRGRRNYCDSIERK